MSTSAYWITKTASQRAVVGMVLWLFSTTLVLAQLPTGFTHTKTQVGYDQPMGLVFSANQQQQFVWDKSGKVWVSTWDGAQYVKQATPALNISDEVGDWRDFGLLSFCLDPNFTQNGLVYLFYVVDRHHLLNAGTPSYNPATNEYYNATISRVTRYRLINGTSGFSTDLSSRKVLLGETKSTGIPLTHQSHAGGTLVFGRDGSLLLTTGDNASYNSVDVGSMSETYFQVALNDGILRTNENVGAFRSQMVTSLCGKVLRLDPVTGDGLGSNPFYESGSPRSAKSRVWALGLRNPYRMAIQPNTGSTNSAEGNPGTLVIGDVGWTLWEDIHLVRQGGENAGWPMYEGHAVSPDYMNAAKTLLNRDEPNPDNICNKPFLTFENLLKQAVPASVAAVATSPCSTMPLPGLQRRYFHSRPALDYAHSSDQARVPTFIGTTATATPISVSAGTGKPFRGNAATAGAFTTGTTFPAAWQNTYYFADYGANWIRATTFNTNGSLGQVREFLPAGSGQGIVDIEFNPLDGSLYYININVGEVMRIGFGGNRPPIAAASAPVLIGTSPLTVNFKGDASTDPDGDPLTYLWDFGDGTTSTQANPIKVFSSNGTAGFVVKLTVSDGRGLGDSRTLQVSLNNTRPTASIANPINNSLYPLSGESTYTLSASVTDESIATLSYAWQVMLRHNNHEHREPVITTANPQVKISPVGCDGETYYYVVKLTVTDSGGLTAQDSVKIYPDCSSAGLAITNLTATSLTAGAQLSWTNPTITFDNVLVLAKAGSGFTDRPTDLTYTADANFTGSGATLLGGKVLYQGVNGSLTVSGLTPGTRYFFRVYTRRGNAWTGGVETSVVPAATVAPPASPVSASIVLTANTCYRLTARVSGKVLSVEAGSLENGGTIRQRTDTNQDWQQWKFSPTSDGFHQVIAHHSGKALEVLGALTGNLAFIQQWGYVGASNQQWRIQRDTEGYYQFTARHSGKLLDIKESNTLEGGEVVQYTANGTQAQQWSIEPRTCVSAAPTPTPDPALLAISNLTATSLTAGAQLSWTNPTISFDNVLVLAKAGSGFTDRPTDLTYTADANFTGGGAALLGGKVLYQGGNNSLTVSSLTPGTRYFFRVYTRSGTTWTGGVETNVVPAASPVAPAPTPIPVPPVSAPIVLTANTCYRLTARVSGKVLGVEAGSLAENAPIRQRTDANQNWQQWKFAPTSDGFYQIIAHHSGKVMDVSGDSYTNLSPINQWAYIASTNQQWAVQADAQGYYQVVSRRSGKLLDVKGSNTLEGGEIVQYTANGTQAQQWSIEPRTCVATSAPQTFDPAKCYRITSRSTGKVLGVTNGLIANGVQIRQYTYTTKAWQQWKIQATSGGFVRISAVHTGKAIDVNGSSNLDMAKLVQWTYGGGSNQQWAIKVNAAGFYTLTARHSGKAIDVRAGNTDEAGDIIQFTVNGTINQQWAITEATCVAAGGRLSTESMATEETLQKSEEKPAGFILWPNPAQDFLLLDLSAAQGQAVEIRLTDVTGRSVHQSRVEVASSEPHRLQVGELSAGLYLVNLVSEGGQPTTLRVLIQR